MKIAITGGGTGGHLNIAKCLLEAALSLDLECIYIGSQSGQDKKWFENEMKFSAKYFLPSSGVVDKKGFAKVKSFFHILNLSFTAQKILKHNQIQAVFSVGGYSAAAASFGALLAGVPLFLHEQNSKSGSLNSLLKPFAKGFYTAFSPTPMPYPVADRFFEAARKRKELKTLIFLGGSQGASFINNLALKLAPKLDEKGVSIIHQCGEKDLQKCQEFYANSGIKADCFAFCEHLEQKMTKADLAVSRAGASTLFELCANALPAVFVPYPYAAKNHQYFNAKFLLDKALCQIFTQDELKFDAKNDYESLLNSIFSMNLSQISSELQAVAQKNGAKILLERALGESAKQKTKR